MVPDDVKKWVSQAQEINREEYQENQVTQTLWGLEGVKPMPLREETMLHAIMDSRRGSPLPSVPINAVLQEIARMIDTEHIEVVITARVITVNVVLFLRVSLEQMGDKAFRIALSQIADDRVLFSLKIQPNDPWIIKKLFGGETRPTIPMIISLIQAKGEWLT